MKNYYWGLNFRISEISWIYTKIKFLQIKVVYNALHMRIQKLLYGIQTDELT